MAPAFKDPKWVARQGDYVCFFFVFFGLYVRGAVDLEAFA